MRIQDFKIVGSVLAQFLIFLSVNAQEWSFVGQGIEGGKVNDLYSFNQKLYAATGNAGIFVSDDQGESWNIINNGITNPEITSIASIGDTLYAGTDSGVHWSFDEGETWEITPGQPDFPQIRTMMAREGVLFAGTFQGLRRSDDRGETWNIVESLTIDGDPLVHVDAIADLGEVIFVGVSFKSGFLSYDEGVSWSFITAVPDNEYLTSAIAIDDVFIVGTADGTIRSVDNGATWEEVSWVNDTRSRQFINVNGVIYASTAVGILKSEDQGSSWIKTHDDQIWCQSILYSDNEIFVGTTFDGVLKSTNLGEILTETNSGLSAEVVNTLISHKEKLYAYTSSGDLLRSENGQDWSPVNRPISSIRDPYSAGDTLFVGSAGSGIYFSTDEATSWSLLPEEGINLLGTRILYVSGTDIFAIGNGRFYILRGNTEVWEEIVIEENLRFPRTMTKENGTLYVHYRAGIYMSEDNGNNWRRLPNDGIEDCCNFWDMSFLNNNIISINGSTTRLYFSEDMGQTWLNNTTQSGSVIDLGVSTGSNLVFASGGTFLFSPDDGLSWQVLTEGLAENFRYSTILEYGDNLYLGGYGGVYSIPLLTFYPKIDAFSQPFAESGESVTIEGSNFSSVGSYNQVVINQTSMEVTDVQSDQITFTVPNDIISGRISVIVNGRTVTSADTLCVNLAQPTISSTRDIDGNTLLTSSSTEGNIWFLDEELIVGANESSLIAGAEGAYSVAVTDGVCESAPSNPFVFVILDVFENDKILPFPNPTIDLVSLRVKGAPPQEYVIQLMDLSGKKMPVTYDFQGDKLLVNLTNLQRGTYLLSLSNGQEHQVVKIYKQ